MTDFNLHKYEFDFFSTNNSLNKCYFQKCYIEKKGLLAKKTDIISTDSKSCNTFKKGSALQEIYENNMSYPFVYKKNVKKNISYNDCSKNKNQDNSKIENNKSSPGEEKDESIKI